MGKSVRYLLYLLVYTALSPAFAQKIDGEKLPAELRKKQHEVFKHTQILFGHQLDSLAQSWQTNGSLTKDSVAQHIDSIRTAQQDLLHWIHDQQRDFLDSVRDEVHGRVDSIISHYDRWSHLELGVDFMSRQVYNGRTTGTSPSFFPSLTYKHFTGLYASVGFSGYFDKAVVGRGRGTTTKLYSSIDMTAGFSRTFFESWDVDVYYNHTFNLFASSFNIPRTRISVSTKNLLVNSFGIYTAYDFFDYVKLGVTYSYSFGSFDYSIPRPSEATAVQNWLDSYNYLTSSHILSFTLSKDFRIYHFLGAKVFSIGPEVALDIGNDNVASTLNAARGLLDSSRTQHFGLLAIDAALNMDYRIKHFEISLSPRLALPFNVYNQTTMVRASGIGTPLFYVSFGVKYLFKFWKETHKEKANHFHSP